MSVLRETCLGRASGQIPLHKNVYNVQTAGLLRWKKICQDVIMAVLQLEGLRGREQHGPLQLWKGDLRRILKDFSWLRKGEGLESPRIEQTL